MNDIIFTIKIILLSVIPFIVYIIGEMRQNRRVRSVAMIVQTLVNIVFFTLIFGMLFQIGKIQIFTQSFLYAIKNELDFNKNDGILPPSSINVIKSIDFYVENRKQTGDAAKSAVLSTEYLKDLRNCCPCPEFLISVPKPQNED